MPSVGMRRTTRVFGARVLRSGRRLWSGSGEVKHMSAVDGDQWIELLDDSGDGSEATQCKENGWHDLGLKQEIAEMDVDKELESQRNAQKDLVNANSVDRMWGAVYQRKRKRMDIKNSDFPDASERKMALDEGRYKIQFTRKQWRKKARESPIAETCDSSAVFMGQNVLHRLHRRQVLSAVVEYSCGRCPSFACFLNLILRYMRRTRVKVPQLCAFLLSEPLVQVFSSHGIHFTQDSPSTKSSGSCKIFGSNGFIPLFSVDFSAVPFCFIHLHSSMLLQSLYLPYAFVMHLGMDKKNDGMKVNDKLHPCNPLLRELCGSKTIAFRNDNSCKRRVLQSSVGAPKLANRNTQSRNGVHARSIQKRRSSLRSRRLRNPSVFNMQKANGTLVSDLFSFRRDGIPLSSATSNCELRSSAHRSSTSNIKELKSTMVGSTQDIESTCCSANILVIEPDKCYREEGAVITLELSGTKQWFLAVKRDGIMRYSLTAQKAMRPSSCNRVTHDIIWTEDCNSWKLEFPNRQDWFIFKELYRECSERNVQTPTVKTIPVPGVHEVSGYADSDDIPFVRPDSYISFKIDEVSRALAKRSAIYEMDSEDEEWLNKLNNEPFAENEHFEHVSEDVFELIVDAFEKAFYCSPDDFSDEKAVDNLCVGLARREVVEAVYSYWMKKRKQKKRAALVRIFQCYQLRRARLVPKSILRKKRSFKRRARRQSGRGKQRTLLQALAEEQALLFDEQSCVLKVQEAKAAASRSEGLAVIKRQKAQLLMENADLATYRATMALRIAEAAQVSVSADAADAFFLQ